MVGILVTGHKLGDFPNMFVELWLVVRLAAEVEHLLRKHQLLVEPRHLTNYFGAQGNQSRPVGYRISHQSSLVQKRK